MSATGTAPGAVSRLASEPVDIPPALRSSVEAVAAAESITVFAALLAGFVGVVHRHTGREEISVRTRPRPGAWSDPARGFVLVRAAVSPRMPFRELARALDEALRAAADARGPAAPPAAPAPPSTPGADAPSHLDSLGFTVDGGLPDPPSIEEYDLALSLDDSSERMKGVVLFGPGDASRAQARRFFGHFVNFVEAACADPERPIDSLPLMSEEERRSVIEGRNAAQRPRLAEQNVSRLVEALAGAHSDETAIAFEGLEWSYRELDGWTNRLARLLRDKGARPGAVVGICMGRSIERTAAVLAVLKAGAAYVALDPDYPRARIEFMLDDSLAPVVLADSRTESQVRGRNAEVVVLDRETVLPEQDSSLDGGAGPEDLAYLIYTSGSTGRPKGVAMPHGALLNLIAWQRDVSPVANARTLQFASLNFDVSFQEIFSTWCAGGTLVLVSEETRRDAAALWRLIDREKVERLFLPFVALQHLAEAAEDSDLEAANLREVITAGEQLQITPQIARLFDPARGRSLHNHYGPSETHVVTAHTLAGDPARWPPLPPIGRPVSNTRVYIVDARGEPVPTGVAGEIWIGGAAVARGYWNRPELTAEKFVADPFVNDAAARIYKTGDLARYRENGEIDFLGRIDHQVKIRGYRVEPGEISAALARHPDVAESAVIACDDTRGGKFLAAYVVSRGGRDTPARDLRAFLKDKLPEYMIPSAFVKLATLPLTPSGKVDRRALPPPETAREDFEAPFREPRDRWESELAEIWKRAFRTTRIGVDDDFFELGGHSLIAGRLFAEIRKHFGKDLPPTTLLHAPTIAGLASLLRDQKDETVSRSLVAIQPRGSFPPLFCMHAGAGTVLYYTELARALGPEQPVYGLQARGLYGGLPPHRGVEEMAAHYAREIRTVQPEGPYYVAGFCFGGVLAYAVAQHLRRDGSRIALLATFDGGSPTFDYAATGGGTANLDQGTIEPVRSRVAQHQEVLRRMTARQKAAYVASRVKARLLRSARRARTSAGMGVADLLRLSGRPLPLFVRETYFRSNSVRATRLYRPEPYPGRMVIFETRGLFRDRELGWSELVRGGFEIHEVGKLVKMERYHAAFIEALAGPLQGVLETVRAGAPANDADALQASPAGALAAE